MSREKLDARLAELEAWETGGKILAKDADVLRHRAYSEAGIEPPPTLLRKIGNYAKAVVRHAANGLEKCGLQQTAARTAACEGCQEYFEPRSRRCLHPDCGCPVAKKVPWKSEDCPKGKWDEANQLKD